MKYFTLLSLSALLVVCGCKKSNDQNGGGGSGIHHVSFKEDGSLKYFIDDVSFTILNGTPGYLSYGMSILGADSVSGSAIQISLQSEEPFAAGKTYISTQVSNPDLNLAILGYLDHTHMFYGSDSTSGAVAVTLTTLTDSVVTGTFSGQVFNTQITSKPSYNLTEGDFRAGTGQ